MQTNSLQNKNRKKIKKEIKKLMVTKGEREGLKLGV